MQKCLSPQISNLEMMVLNDISSAKNILSLLSLNILLAERIKEDPVEFDLKKEDSLIYKLLFVEDLYGELSSQRLKYPYYKKACLLNICVDEEY